MKSTRSLFLLLCVSASPLLADEENQGAPEAVAQEEVAPVVEPQVVAQEEVVPVAEVVELPLVEVPAVQEMAPVVDVAPAVVEQPVAEPAVVPAPAVGLPTEADIAMVSRLIAAYKTHVTAMQNVREASAIDATPGVADEALVLSLLNLLTIHKKEEALIDHLRGSIAALKNMLNNWENDVEQLLKEKHFLPHHHHGKKPKHDKKHNNKKRDVDFGIIKEQSSKPRPTK